MAAPLQGSRFGLNGARMPALPTGVVVPDLSAKRSLVLDSWNRERRAQHARRQLNERLALQARAYEGAAHNRLTADWVAMHTSADAELASSLRDLRARSRQLVRDNPYAKHAVRVIVNNVVGTGIRMQAVVANARGTLQTSINDSIEAAHAEWAQAKTCHVGGLLSLTDLERVAMAQLVAAGECIVRLHRVPFGGGKVPLALELIEADRLLDQWQVVRAPNGNIIRMGVEIDQWHRPVAYWFNPNHPGDGQFASTFSASQFLRVPAEDIIHLYLVDRWPQTRGEPWFHAALRSLHDVNGFEEAVIVKARASANVVGFIRGGDPLPGSGDGKTVATRQVLDTEPGTWQRLLDGEDVTGYPTAAPDPSVEPFLRYLLRKNAISVGITYESFSGDYSKSNYSSSRMGLLPERDQWRVIQGYIIRALRMPLDREFRMAGALVGAFKAGEDFYSNPAKWLAVRFRPRGWSSIDPAKEVLAYRAAVRAGFMSQEDVIAQVDPSGDDYLDLIARRKREVEAEDEAGLVFDTNPAKVNDKGQSVDPAAGSEPAGAAGGDGDGGSGAAAGEGEDDINAE